jgi:6-phosphogluconolactonase (cycloisomerase 2 family)
MFDIDAAKGTLTYGEDQSSGGKTPRHFGIDPSGQFLIAANQNSSTLLINNIDPKNGRLKPVEGLVSAPTPVCVVFLPAAATGAPSREQGRAKQQKPLPPAVSKAIEQNRPGAEIDKLDVEKEHGIAFYDVEFRNQQGEMDIAEDGTVLDIATVIEMKDLPEPVAAAIKRAGKGKAIKQLTRSEVRAEIVNEKGKARVARLTTPRYVYEAEFSSGEVELTPEGKIIKLAK